MSKPLAEVPLDSKDIRKGGFKCSVPISHFEEQLKAMGVMTNNEKIVQVNVFKESLDFVMEYVDND